jgi:hypothetical protein
MPADLLLEFGRPLLALEHRERRAQRAGYRILGDQPAQLVGRRGGQQDVFRGETVRKLAPGQPGDDGQGSGDSCVGAHGRQVAAERPFLAIGVALLFGLGQAGDPGSEIGEHGHARPATHHAAAKPRSEAIG